MSHVLDLKSADDVSDKSYTVYLATRGNERGGYR
jgi:hypothetical protein